MLLPVLVIAWIEGNKGGLLIACFAAAMWAAGDVASDRQFSSEWIPWANAATRVMVYSLVAMLAAAVSRRLEREHETARQGALTGLQNRRAFLDAGNFEIERAKRYAHPVTVIFLDLDDFKRLNDSKGHDAGDAALRTTAKALVGGLRSSDRVARLGGDEFAVLLPEIGYEQALEAGRKIAMSVDWALGVFPPVRASIGVAWFGQADRTFPAMLKAADDLMYEVKKGGKGAMLTRYFSAAVESNENP